MSWDDAQAYVAFLSARTGRTYRLPSESEFEYAARAGAATTFPWGDEAGDVCAHANGFDFAAKRNHPDWTSLECHDGFAFTAPVRTFPANAFGLYGMTGNVFQWTEDCFHDSYEGAPADGSAWTSPNCSVCAIRGGSWLNGARGLRAAMRDRDPQHALTPISASASRGRSEMIIRILPRPASLRTGNAGQERWRATMKRLAATIVLSAALIPGAAAQTDKPAPEAEEWDASTILSGGRPRSANLERMIADAAAFPLGSERNPLRVDGPSGEWGYLTRLRCGDGTAPRFERQGSRGGGAFGSIVDIYALRCAGGEPGETTVFMDMYHPQHDETAAPPGFTLAPR